MQALIQQLPLSSLLALVFGVMPALAGCIAAYVAGYLRSDGFNRYINAVIAGMVILAFAGLSMVVADAVSGNWSFSLQAIQASVVMLAFGQMKPLMVDVQAVVGFTAQGFVLIPQKQVVAPLAPTQPRLQAMSTPRATTAVMPAAKKVTIVPPTTDHAG